LNRPAFALQYSLPGTFESGDLIVSDVIQVENVTVRYRDCEPLSKVNLTIPKGRVFALLGENGVGKTTLIRCLTGYLKPTTGQCRVLGFDPTKDALEIRRRVGYVSDAPAFYEWMKVEEVAWFAASFYPDGFLQRFKDSADKYELPLTRKIKHLSKGQRAKVALALALAHDPELLIMDEPTSGLDPLVRREFLESMLDRVAVGQTVFLSSHHISEIERVADDIAILHQGKFRVHDSLTNLRDTVSEVTITMQDPFAALPRFEAPAEILSEEIQDRQRRFVIYNLAEDQKSRLESLPTVASVRLRPATLDELFVACTRGKPSELNPVPPDDKEVAVDVA
jgi:ABC-2 type transport system ATP-binding protein